MPDTGLMLYSSASRSKIKQCLGCFAGGEIIIIIIGILQLVALKGFSTVIDL